MQPMMKYPRTPHLVGSNVQVGDEDVKLADFTVLDNRCVVVEEKVDGANCGICFDDQGNLLIQSRGHYLQGGPREKHWTLMKHWANTHFEALLDALENRYVLFGEWLYAKHTLFYDELPHYLMEFDLYDRRERVFLDTRSRAERLVELPLPPVRVMHRGPVDSLEQLWTFMGRSAFVSAFQAQRLSEAAEHAGVDPKLAAEQTDLSAQMEGLYLKIEADGIVQGRYKLVRPEFTQSFLDIGEHWLSRPLLVNRLQDGADLFNPDRRWARDVLNCPSDDDTDNAAHHEGDDS